MEEESAMVLLQRYRRDRRMLLNFLLSGSIIKKVVMPPGAVSLDDVDLDQVCVDHVLDCARKGTLLELSDAIRAYHDRTGRSQLINTGSRNEFFLVTKPDSSGSPPGREAPPVPSSVQSLIPSFSPSSAPFEPSGNPDPALSLLWSSVARAESFSSQQFKDITVDGNEDRDDGSSLDVESRRISRRNINDAAELVPNLPTFATGINDDDLRETAYEILLACAGASGGLIVPIKEKKDSKRSKLIIKLRRSKTENVMAPTGLVGLLERIRVQMEISEAMDIRTRQGLLNAMVGKGGKRIDSLLIPLELLCSVSRTEFSDKKAYIKWQRRQLYMLEEGLINHATVGFSEYEIKSVLRIFMAKIEESESFPASTSDIQRTESLRALREITVPLAERPGHDDLTGEVCHWADGYHLNVRIYEKLLLGVFDVLHEGKLTEEVEEILELLKSTWRVLGVTETIHCTCYAWVLFRQYVMTNELGMLQHAIGQLSRIPLEEQRVPQESSHLRSLHAKVDIDDGFSDVSFLQSYLMPIQRWVDKRLGDYHMHFPEVPTMLESVLKTSMISRRLLLEEPEMMQSMSVYDHDQIESYISSSINSAFSRVLLTVEKSEETHDHPLALLAEETKRLVQKDSNTFMPIFSERHPKAAIVSASLIHRFYGHKLKPFLDSVEHITEDVMSVFPAADSLEQYIISLISSTCGEENVDFYTNKLSLYQIETASGTLVMRWVNAQLEGISNWVDRAIQQERWEPISTQLCHGPSIVEVHRIFEETVDQFFAITIPVRLMELNSMLRGLDNALQKYANRVVDGLVSKEELIPPEPVLSRYKKETRIKAFVKKELFETPKLRGGRISVDISVRTTRTLCVQLNTLHYAISQLNKLEDSIWNRWAMKKPDDKFTNDKSESMTRKDAFDGSRKELNTAMDRICEFTGTKIVFCDLRDPFIEALYKPSVSQSRLEALLEPLDLELNQLCGVIAEPLRDRIVTSLLQASLDGLLRALLNGGPSRVFFPSDAKLLEEDIEALKEFFISGGDGLPRGEVENKVARVCQVVKLHGYETRELIDDLRSLRGAEQGTQSRLGADANTLIRILCHRNDSEASKFLKKQYKIPKSSA